MRLQLPRQTRQATTFLIERLLGLEGEGLEPRVHQDILGLALQEILREETPNTERPPSYRHRRRVGGSRPRPPGERRDAAVSLEELCEIAHVSQRTLRYSFTSILGVSPIQFLRLTRLNRVRRRLCEPEAETTVSQAAADWGFYHLGQFAGTTAGCSANRPPPPWPGTATDAAARPGTTTPPAMARRGRRAASKTRY